MYGNGILHYYYNSDSDVSSLKMRYQPMTNITVNLLTKDKQYQEDEGNTWETTNQDYLLNFISDGDYPISPSFLDLANQYRATLGQSARSNVANDSEYNDCLREACKQVGYSAAEKISLKRTGLRYKGQVALKGTHLNPGDLVQVTNPFIGLNSQLLRVLDVTHNINQNGWETTITVQEDEKAVS